MKTFYMSFADEEGFRGVLVVDAETPEDAVRRSLEMKLHPGGQALILEVAPRAKQWLEEKCKYRLLSKDDITAIDGGEVPKSLKELDAEQSAAVHHHAVVVCDRHGPEGA